MRYGHALLVASLSLFGFACGDDKTPLAASATASALAPTTAKAESAQKLSVDGAASKVSFNMEAPQEKIRGKVDGAITGQVFVDPADLTKTTGSIAVDLSNLEVFQRLEEGGFAEEKKNPTQNEHAREWLEIGPSAPADLKAKYARVEFAVRSVESVSQKDVTKLQGDERAVTAKVKGDFLLHGRQAEKSAELEITFVYAGDKLKGARLKTQKPLTIGLAEFDVRPRESFGKLAQKTLDVLAPKVAKEAMVELDVVLNVGDAPAPGASASASAAPAASESAAPPDASASAAPPASASAPPAAGSAAPASTAAPTGAPKATATPGASPAPAPTPAQ